MKDKVAIIGAGQGAIAFSLRWIINKIVDPENLTIYEPQVKSLHKRFETMAEAKYWEMKIADPENPTQIKSKHKIKKYPHFTNNIAKAVKGAKFIHIITPAHYHRMHLKHLMSHIDQEDAYLIIHSEGIGGALCALKIIKDNLDGRNKKKLKTLKILAIETLAFSCKAFVDEDKKTVTSWVKRQKDYMHVTGIPLDDLEDNVEKIQHFFEPTELKRCRDPIEVGINDTPAFHVIGMLGNVPKMLRVARGEEGIFNFYLEITPGMAQRMENLDHERALVAMKMGLERPTNSREFLQISYHIPLTDPNTDQPRTLYEMIQDPLTPYYGGPEVSPAPTSILHRYMTEEIPTRIVPTYSLGQALGVDMPEHERVLNEVRALGLERVIKEGRTLKAMGLTKQNVKRWKKKIENGFV